MVSTVPSPQSMVQEVIVSSPGSVAPSVTEYEPPAMIVPVPVTVRVGGVLVMVRVVVSVAVVVPSSTSRPMVWGPPSSV